MPFGRTHLGAPNKLEDSVGRYDHQFTSNLRKNAGGSPTRQHVLGNSLEKVGATAFPKVGVVLLLHLTKRLDDILLRDLLSLAADNDPRPFRLGCPPVI